MFIVGTGGKDFLGRTLTGTMTAENDNYLFAAYHTAEDAALLHPAYEGDCTEIFECTGTVARREEHRVLLDRVEILGPVAMPEFPPARKTALAILCALQGEHAPEFAAWALKYFAGENPATDDDILGAAADSVQDLKAHAYACHQADRSEYLAAFKASELPAAEILKALI